MAESHVVTALVTKRAEMAGLIEHHRKEMGRLAVDRPAAELLNDPNLNRLFLGGHAKD